MTTSTSRILGVPAEPFDRQKAIEAHLRHMVDEWLARVEAIESGRPMDHPDVVIERNARKSLWLLEGP